MALGGNIGNGTKVAYSAASPVAWSKVAQLLDVSKFLSLVANDVDTTVHSTSRIMTSMPGMFPVPEIDLDLLADLNETTSPSQEALRNYQANGTTLYWRVEIPTDRAQTLFRGFEFQAYLKSWDLSKTTQIANRQEIAAILKFAGGYWVQATGASVIG